MKSLWTGPAALGECPVWHEQMQRLYWIDCVRRRVYQYVPVSGEIHEWVMPHTIGCIAPAEGPYLVGFMGGAVIKISVQDGSFDIVQQIVAADSGFRCNDGKCDPMGRFWCGTVSRDLANPNSSPTGSLYRVDLDGCVTPMRSDLYISNGIGWSPDHRYMYHCDSWRGVIYRYAFELDTGDIHEQTTWLRYPGLGVPDGLTVDAEGYIWTAVWGGGKLLRIDPAGKVCREIIMPVTRPTSCIFGQSDFSTLYVTSCAQDADEQEALPAPNGSVYEITGLGQGVAESVFAGGR